MKSPVISQDDLNMIGDELVYKGFLSKNTLLADFKAAFPNKSTEEIAEEETSSMK